MLTFTHNFQGRYFSLKFSDKPSAAIRATLKGAGFRWSPSAGEWWRNGVAGGADFIEALRRQIDRESGIRRVDGACWDCGNPDGYFRNYGAATPVRCDACESKRRAEYAAEQHRADTFDMAYEDACARACGL